MDGKIRNNISIGALVDIVLKKDQPTGKLTRGMSNASSQTAPPTPTALK